MRGIQGQPGNLVRHAILLSGVVAAWAHNCIVPIVVKSCSVCAHRQRRGCLAHHAAADSRDGSHLISFDLCDLLLDLMLCGNTRLVRQIATLGGRECSGEAVGESRAAWWLLVDVGGVGGCSGVHGMRRANMASYLAVYCGLVAGRSGRAMKFSKWMRECRDYSLLYRLPDRPIY